MDRKISQIVHYVDSIEALNIGIWRAAVMLTPYLNHNSDFKSSLLVAKKAPIPTELTEMGLDKIIFTEDLNKKEFVDFLKEQGFNKADTIIISHGMWRQPTRFSSYAAKKGYRWMYVPHGMLEPWAMNHKGAKKKIYFRTIEKPMVKRASVIRGVSEPETNRLLKIWKNVVYIPNGIHMPLQAEGIKPVIRNFLFLGRLHLKKAVTELVQAWINSQLNNNLAYRLQIAGPDEGELIKINALLELNPSNNIELLGPVGGLQKHLLFSQAWAFILPSHSEGLPTTVLEAIHYNCLLYLSEGVNFTEVFDAHACIVAPPDPIKLSSVLNAAVEVSPSEVEQKTTAAIHILNSQFRPAAVASKLVSLIKSIES